jgi:CRISPR-associated protein Csc2
VQAVYDALEKPLEHPLNAEKLAAATKQVISTWNNKRGVSVHLSEAELVGLIEDIDQHWSEADAILF